MAITTVGTLVNSYVTSSQSTVSLTTVNVGDCVVAELTILANIQITGVSSPHVTWREVAGPLYNSTLVATTHKWVGTVTAVSTANVTLTFSAAIGSNVLQRTITQLSAGLGSSCQWFSFAGSQTNASSTTMAYPPLSATYANLGYTPAGGAPIAYVGYALGLNAGSAGSTPGFTYTLDTIVAPLAVDTNVALNSTPAPTASQSPAAVSYSTAVLLMPVPITAPGGDFDLTNWYLTLPTDDGSGGAATVQQPSLNTYADSNFDLDGSGRMVMTAPVNGFTTSGSSATRCELREQQGGSNAAWDMSTTTRSLTVSGFYDATSITGGSNPRQEQIIGQIHSTGGTPPLYLSMNFSTTPTELQVFQDSNGSIGNLITGFTSSTRIAYRIEVVGGNVNVYGVAGDETALPGTPQFSLPHTGFTETTGCYLKAGSYNKTDTGTGATGQAVATVAYLQLVQGPTVTRTTSDTVGLSDTQTRSAQAVSRTLTDTLGLSDVTGRAALQRTVSDTVGVVDTATPGGPSTRTLLNPSYPGAALFPGPSLFPGTGNGDTVGLADTVTRASQSFTRAVADTVGVVDRGGPSSKVLYTFTDTVGLSGAASRTTTDVISLSDSVVRAAQAFTRTTADAVGLSDVVARSAQAGARTLAETAQLSDTVTRAAQTRTRGSTDTIAVSDVQTRAAQNLSRNLTDAVGAVDSIARAAQTAARSLLDSAGLVDTVGRGPQGFTRATADTVSVSDAIVRSAQSQTRGLVDTAGVSDAVGRGTQSFTRALVDTVSLVDSQVRAGPGGARTVSDTIAVSETQTRAGQAFTRSLSDVVPAIGIVVLGLVFNVADRIGLADVETGAPQAFTAAFSDSVALSDSQTRSVQAFTRALLETAGVSDNVAQTAQTFVRAASDTVGIADAMGRTSTSRVLSITDTLGLADIQARVAQMFSRSFTDGLGFADGQARAALNLARGVSDALGLSDAALQGRTFVRAIADGLGLPDNQASSTRLSVRAVADAAGLVDTQSALSRSGLTTADSAVLVDAVSAHGSASRSALDGVAAADVVAAAEYLTRSAADSLGLTGSLAKRMGATSAVDELRLADQPTAHLVVLPLGIGVPAVVGVLATGFGPGGVNAPYIAY